MPTLKWNSKTGIYALQWSPFYLGCQGPMAYNALQSYARMALCDSFNATEECPHHIVMEQQNWQW
jgi:hypothetical protein